MKMQFSHRRRYGTGGSSGSRAVWGFGIAILVIAVVVGVHTFLPNVFVALVTPLWEKGTNLSASVSAASANLDSKSTLAAENAVLDQRVQTLTNENQVLTARSEDLTKELGGSSDASTELLAGVLARPPESPYDTLTVAAGSKDGSAAGAFVYSSGGIPIGTVQTVTSDTSTILLFSTSGRSTSGWIGENRIPVTLTGAGAGAFSATIPETSSVAVGDTVYVPGPGALPIGTIVKIDTDPSSPTAVLHIQPLVNLFSITWVEIARP
jgi:cell shape-determining protein MreC